MNDKIHHRIGRIKQLFCSESYRSLLKQRFLAWFIGKVNPNIIYLGVKTSSETMLLHRHDNAVTPCAMSTGAFQKDDLRKLCAILSQENKTLGGAFIDIGGNIGSTSIYAALAKKFCHVYCFEPIPANISLARANIALNNLEDKIDLINKAMSDKLGSVEMVLSEANCGDHRISEMAKDEPIKKAQKNRNFKQFIQTVVVETTTIDEFIRTTPNASTASVIWSDTQGFEGRVLQGGIEFIQRTKVPLCLEFWPFGLRSAGCLSQFIDIVSSNYTKFYDLSAEVPAPEDISRLGVAVERYPTEFTHTDMVFL